MRIKKNLGVILILIGLFFTFGDVHNPDTIVLTLTMFVERYWSVGLIVVGAYFYGYLSSKTSKRH